MTEPPHRYSVPGHGPSNRDDGVETSVDPGELTTAKTCFRHVTRAAVRCQAGCIAPQASPCGAGVAASSQRSQAPIALRARSSYCLETAGRPPCRGAQRGLPRVKRRRSDHTATRISDPAATTATPTATTDRTPDERSGRGQTSSSFCFAASNSFCDRAPEFFSAASFASSSTVSPAAVAAVLVGPAVAAS